MGNALGGLSECSGVIKQRGSAQKECRGGRSRARMNVPVTTVVEGCRRARVPQLLGCSSRDILRIEFSQAEIYISKKRISSLHPVVVIIRIQEDGSGDVEQTPARGNHQMQRQTRSRGYFNGPSDTPLGKWKGLYAHVQHSHGGG